MPDQLEHEFSGTPLPLGGAQCVQDVLIHLLQRSRESAPTDLARHRLARQVQMHKQAKRPVKPHTGRDMAKTAMEEAIDLAVSLQALVMEMDDLRGVLADAVELLARWKTVLKTDMAPQTSSLLQSLENILVERYSLPDDLRPAYRIASRPTVCPDGKITMSLANSAGRIVGHIALAPGSAGRFSQDLLEVLQAFQSDYEAGATQ